MLFEIVAVKPLPIEHLDMSQETGSSTQRKGKEHWEGFCGEY